MNALGWYHVTINADMTPNEALNYWGVTIDQIDSNIHYLREDIQPIAHGTAIESTSAHWNQINMNSSVTLSMRNSYWVNVTFIDEGPSVPGMGGDY